MRRSAGARGRRGKRSPDHLARSLRGPGHGAVRRARDTRPVPARGSGADAFPGSGLVAPRGRRPTHLNQTVRRGF
ncbi:hypothetical protein J2S22_000805 [Rhodoplanes tepidamans]|nr:hypothetical protein [Rhodoplanes tepidamans]